MKGWLIAVLLLLGACTLPVLAQSSRVITQDDVNAVAERMYCPVCENIPLDDCGTATCAAWKDEIGAMLARGFTTQQIIDDFVQRYGEKVVGVPQDATLRLLSWSLPVIGVFGALLLALATFSRWHKRKNEPPLAVAAPEAGDDAYRQLFEQDVR